MVRAAAGSRQRWAGLVPGLQAKEKERVLLRPAMVSNSQLNILNP